MRGIITLGPGACSAIETGARYFSALAYPLPREERAREDAAKAWVASYLHAANRIDRCNAPFKDRRLNSYLELPPKWCAARLRTTKRRLRDRGTYARSLRPLIGEKLRLAASCNVPLRSTRQRAVSEYLDAHNFVNLEQRVFRASRPVAHILIAQDLLLTQIPSDSYNFETDLASTGLLEWFVETGSRIARIVAADRRFRVRPEQMLEFRWTS